MTASVVLMTHTGDKNEVIGDPQHADGWYGFSDGRHTVSFNVQNFKGRIWIQASLELEPKECDWFDIWLSCDHPYLQYPINPASPTGQNGGDSGTLAMTFHVNALWVRAVYSREYLLPPNPNWENYYGAINKIVLSR